ncbi:MAG: peptide chain release factor N(5)-glutamine methyltransferase [Gammaproteobacteria bacterium]
MKSIKDCLAWADTMLPSSATPRLDAECLLMFVTKLKREQLLMFPEQLISDNDIERFKQLVSSRQQGEPIAYLIGEKDFWNLTLKVTADTLVPRPETETLVEFILKECQQPLMRMLDLGTGTGAIALALAEERPEWEIWASDDSDAALEVAKQNAILNQIIQVRFHQGHYFEGLPEQYFNLICSNPPYLSATDPYLSGDIRFEPLSALVSGKTGLECLESIIKIAPTYLTEQGWLVLEHGYNQAESVSKLFTARFHNIQQSADLSGIVRMTAGQLR